MIRFATARSPASPGGRMVGPLPTTTTSNICASTASESPSTEERWMTAHAEEVTPTLLRNWPLARAEGSKHDRGRVIVVGGARRTPGAVQLAGVAALRVGAGHLTLGVAE